MEAQSGVFTPINPLEGNPGSKYSQGPQSMARAALGFAVPLRASNPYNDAQGSALQALSSGQLAMTNYQAQQKKALDRMAASGAPQAAIDARAAGVEKKLQQMAGELDRLAQVTGR